MTVKVVSISNEGKMTLKFSATIFNPNASLSDFNKTCLSQVKIKYAYTDEIQSLKWSVNKLSNDTAIL